MISRFVWSSFSAGKALDGSRDAHTDTFASIDMHTETHKWSHAHIAGTACWLLQCNLWGVEFIAE